MQTPQIDFTGAEWWWPEALTPEPNQYADFACDLELPELPVHAVLALSCGTWYTLWVNGEWILHGPPREVAPYQYYDVADLRGHLKQGLNRLRIRAYHAGISNQSHQACLAGLLLRGSASGDRWSVDLADRNHWGAAQAPGFLPGAPRLHHCNYFGEHVDLTVEPSTWLHADKNPSWKAPEIVARYPLLGREKLMPSDLPTFSGRIWEAHCASVANGWQAWDFGGEVFGFLQVELETTQSGTCELLQGESLTETGLPDFAYAGGDFRDILELPTGLRRWESFDKRALRYLALPAWVTVRSLRVREYHRPLLEVWRASPSAARLTAKESAVLTAAARTVTLCCDDLLNDCPRRERGQYNDPAAYMEAFPLLFGTWEPFRRWLHQFRRGAGLDGVLRMCYPSPPGFGVIPDFSISFAESLWRYYEYTGDRETLALCYPQALAGVEAFTKYEDRNGLLCDVPGWIFLCNSFELAKFPHSAALNALWASAWRHLSLIANALGVASAYDYEERWHKRRAAWRNCFWHDGRILDADSSPEHDQHAWWNYHYEADRGRFANERVEPGSFALRIEWKGTASHLYLAMADGVRLWCNGELLWQGRADSPWTRPYCFNPTRCELPKGFCGGELLLEVAYNRIDWEVYIALEEQGEGRHKGERQKADGRLQMADSRLQMAEGAEAEGQKAEGTEAEWAEGAATSVYVGEISSRGTASYEEVRAAATRATTLRRWFAPRHNQITTGYAVSSGMLAPAEAVENLKSCLREVYNVPWMKRTTPLICTPTDDEAAIRDRVVLCNTPQSLGFFCRALAAHGMHEEARLLCLRIYGRMIDEGATTLWEEFAPRSSLCHAWGAMCVRYLLSS
ncbi:MAG: hypothetical protein SFY80_04205 [Verrucomicrobiota bacterium]|nr:hypothetical protein [Verrucomicrobiota bacterium]